MRDQKISKAAAAALLVLVLFADAHAATMPSDSFLLDDVGATILTAADVDPRPARFAFPPGERLVYQIQAAGIAVGTAELRVARWLAHDGHRIAHVVATGRTNDALSVFFPIRDRMEAWIDVDTGRTLRSATWTRHGRRKESVEYATFDQEAHFLERVEEEKHRARLRESGIDLGPRAMDMLEAFYAARSLSLSIGETTRLPVVASRKVYELRLAVAGREEVEWQGTRANAWVVHPSSHLDGEPLGNGRGELRIIEATRGAPLRLDGWFATPSGFRVLGVDATLVTFDGGELAWPLPEGERTAERFASVTTLEGEPDWEIPSAVRLLRRERGLVPYSRKTPISTAR